MPKAAQTKKKPVKKPDEKLVVNGSFLDIIDASIKHANDKSAQKKGS